jgi:hypothetical protein
MMQSIIIKKKKKKKHINWYSVIFLNKNVEIMTFLKSQCE